MGAKLLVNLYEIYIPSSKREDLLTIFCFLLVLFLMLKFNQLYEILVNSDEIHIRNPQLRSKLDLAGTILTVVGVFFISYRFSRIKKISSKVIILLCQIL